MMWKFVCLSVSDSLLQQNIPDIYSMCGIAGIIQIPSAGYSLSQVQQMTDALAHRGPDGEGHWENTDQTVLLGHRRLAVIDLSSAGIQPMHYAGRYTIVHNGEIYNYRELRETLQSKGYSFRTATDTEVIAAAYDCWKEDCLHRFDGMFAFAIWDEQKRELFAARDRFGEKPFYYYQDNQVFIFASEIKALHAAGINRIPNQQLLFNFISIGYTDNPSEPEETFFTNIYKLPPACLLKFSQLYMQFTTRNWWSIDPEKQDEKISAEAAIEKFTALFNQSVKHRLRSDVPIGTSLSGGLDSSAVAATIHQLHDPVHSQQCFTAVFPGYEKDEARYAQQVADTFNLQQHIVAPDSNGLLNDWDKLCYHQDEPFGSASIYAQYKVYEAAREKGITVLLDGQGADETLAGYRNQYKWYWQELFRRRKLRRSGELKAAREAGINEPFDYRNKIAAYFPSFASVVMERRYLLKALQQEDLTREFVELQSREAYYTPPDIFSLNGILHFQTFTHGLEELLRFADRNAMAHGIEVRLPFLQHELVEFVFSLPATYKIREAWSKWLLRKSVDGLLPDAITWRRDKTGFEPPQQQWMLDPSLKEKIMTARQVLVNEKILKPAVMDKPVAALPAHAADNYDWRYFSAASLFK